MNKPARAVLSTALMSASFGAAAATLVDTLGDGSDGAQQVGWMVSDPGNGSNFSPYAAFVAPLSGRISEAIVSLQYLRGPEGSLTFELRADENGRPGELLGSALGAFTALGGRTAADFQGKAAVEAGSTYWFGLTTQSPDTLLGWHLSPLGLSGATAYTGEVNAPGDWYVQGAAQGAFQLSTVSAVPNPAGWAVMLVGLGVIALNRSMARRT